MSELLHQGLSVTLSSSQYTLRLAMSTVSLQCTGLADFQYGLTSLYGVLLTPAIICRVHDVVSYDVVHN